MDVNIISFSLQEVICKLTEAGHEVVPWQPMDFKEVYRTFADFVFADKVQRFWHFIFILLSHKANNNN